MDDLKTSFIDGTKGCTFECQSILLGALMKNMVAHGILKGGRGYYFTGMSVAEAVHAVKAIKPLDVSWAPNGYGYHHCSFSLGDVTSTFAESVMDNAKPLELKGLKDVVVRTQK